MQRKIALFALLIGLLSGCNDKHRDFDAELKALDQKSQNLVKDNDENWKEFKEGETKALKNFSYDEVKKVKEQYDAKKQENINTQFKIDKEKAKVQRDKAEFERDKILKE